MMMSPVAPSDEHEQKEQGCQAHIELRQLFHPAIQSAINRDHRNSRNTDNDQDLQIGGRFNPEQHRFSPAAAWVAP